MSVLLEDLNEEQRLAVTSTEGYIRVIAGAGSGKTRALSRRFAFLVNEVGILPKNILCVTFTNKSANEMRQRIHDLTGDNDTGYVNTFHGFCVSILQEDSYAAGYPKSFLVIDNTDIDEMLKIIYEERGLTLRDMTFSSARDMIEIRKLFEDPEYYEDLINWPADRLYARYREAVRPRDIIFYGYLYQEKKCFALDYNDLIKFSLHIFDINEEIRKKWQQRLEYIMIDEFQDIDLLQYQLMRVLCAYHENLFVVGDPDQTIYSWRGADIKYLKEFDREFPDTQTILMNKNYRSAPPIVAAANSLIGKNEYRIPKDLEAMCGGEDPVVCHFAANSEKEAQWICGQIESLQEKGVSLRDITVLYRAHYLTRAVEEVFIKNKIPYTIYSGVQFFGRREIKDALCYLRMIAFRDDLSFRRIVNVPKRNIGQRRMQFLEEYAAQNGTSLYEALQRNLDRDILKGTSAAGFVRLIEELSEGYENRTITDLLSDVLDRSGYEDMLRTEGSQERLDNLAELKQSVFDYEISCGEETNLESYMKHAALFTNMDAGDTSDRVKLMTVHAAKGLEFPYVFLCGMNEGVFPSRKIRTADEMDEERRLAFVALTRAEKQLFLSAADGRGFDGAPKYPSRFLLDIDQALLSYDEPPRDGLIRETEFFVRLKEKRLAGGARQKLFREGDRVVHSVMGPGTVLSVDPDAGAYSVQFDNRKTARTISFRAAMLPAGQEAGRGTGEGQ